MVDSGLFYMEKPNNAEEDTPMDDCPESADKLHQFMVMSRLGLNLDNYFDFMEHKLPEVSIYSLAIKMITLLECVHKMGMVFNDLKLDNLMVDYGDQLPVDSKNIENSTDVFEGCTISLVDFGFVTSVVDKQTR